MKTRSTLRGAIDLFRSWETVAVLLAMLLLKLMRGVLGIAGTATACETFFMRGETSLGAIK